GPLQGWFARRAVSVGVRAALGDGTALLGGRSAGEDGADPGTPAPTIEEDVGGAIVRGLGSLLGGRKKNE
ncbi:MAG: hypothetical protein AAF205_12920, partial [Pseudomonadota bacterium]